MYVCECACVRVCVYVPGDVVDHECSSGPPVIAACDGPEALLARRVPDLQLDLLAAHLDYPRAKLHADRVGAVRHDYKHTHTHTHAHAHAHRKPHVTTRDNR